MNETGIVLFAHGARDPRWKEPFERVRAAVERHRPGTLVVLAYLEIMTPDLSSAVRSLAEQGVARVRIVPLFFGRGGHLREDFPRQVEAAQAAAPAVALEVLDAAGEDPAVVEALAAFAIAGFV